MARIPDAEIERIKQEVSLERLVEASGVELKKTGKDLFGRCPFHADETASLSVTPAKNLWHCLGACGEGGDELGNFALAQHRHATVERGREIDEEIAAIERRCAGGGQ